MNWPTSDAAYPHQHAVMSVHVPHESEFVLCINTYQCYKQINILIYLFILSEEEEEEFYSNAIG